MTTFTRTWSSGYNAIPDDQEDASLGAGRIRDFKTDIKERVAVDHSFAGDANDGLHSKVTLIAATAPSTPPAGQAVVYLATGQTTPSVKDSSGNVTSITGVTGEIKIWPTNSIPTGFIICNGAAVSRSTFAALFAVIGTIYGAGDGSTTFNLPNLAGRFPIGVSGAHALATFGGSETVTLSTANLPAHNHAVTDPGHAHGVTDNYHDGAATAPSIATQGGSGYGINPVGHATSTAAATTGITTQNTGSGTAVTTVPPFLSINFIIKT